MAELTFDQFLEDTFQRNNIDDEAVKKMFADDRKGAVQDALNQIAKALGYVESVWEGEVSARRTSELYQYADRLRALNAFLD